MCSWVRWHDWRRWGSSFNTSPTWFCPKPATQNRASKEHVWSPVCFFSAASTQSRHGLALQGAQSCCISFHKNVCHKQLEKIFDFNKRFVDSLQEARHILSCSVCNQYPAAWLQMTFRWWQIFPAQVRCQFDPPWNFLYRIATVKLGKMVRFNPLLCWGVPTQCQRLQFYRGPWRHWFYRDFMLNTALSTSQLRVLGTAILEWDMFSLDVYQSSED